MAFLTSSVAVLSGAPGQVIDESMRRNPEEADDYYRSKILADRKVDAFLETHLDMWACMVLPGWMVGPGDVGPTSSGQMILDFLYRKLPGIPPATFSMVEAREVAEAMWLAAQRGRRGERYLAAGRHMSMGDLFQKLEQVSGIAAPRWNAPLLVLYAMAAANEIWAGITKKVGIDQPCDGSIDEPRTRAHAVQSRKERARTGDSVSTGRGDYQRHDPLVPTERLAENPGAEENPAACGGTAHRKCRKTGGAKCLIRARKYQARKPA
jgi:nucleoside-diphosphate-sugar epimerase